MTAHLEIDYLPNTLIRFSKWINTLRFNDHLGGTAVNKGPTCTDRGPSVQVQFPHLKISTLTTVCK